MGARGGPPSRPELRVVVCRAARVRWLQLQKLRQ